MSKFDEYQAGDLFILEKDMPQLAAGTIFELRNKTAELGSSSCGFLTNIFINGDCQSGWCAETHMVPGQLANDTEWFSPVERLVGEPDGVFVVNNARFRRV